MLPRSGDILHVTRAASVQFIEPIIFRVIRVHDWPTYDGWVWLDGYELNTTGEAVERRSIFVQIDGLRYASATADPRVRNARVPGKSRGPRPDSGQPNSPPAGTNAGSRHGGFRQASAPHR